MANHGKAGNRARTRAVRARMAVTGENWTAAARHIDAQGATTPQAPAGAAASAATGDAPATRGGERPRRAQRPQGYGTSVAPDVTRMEPVSFALCTPEDFPGVLGDDYPGARVALGLPPAGPGCALVTAQDVAGARWTVITSDVEGVSTVLALSHADVVAGYTLRVGQVLAVRPGWVIPSPLGLIDRPAPHDPAHPDLPAPDPSWTAVRRMLADRIAEELEEPPGCSREDHLTMVYGDDVPPRFRISEMLAQPADPSDPAILDLLAEARGLAARPHRPRGTVRIVTGGQHVRMVRASGPGWSLIARPAAGPVIGMTDQTPGKIWDLTAVDAAADLVRHLATSQTAQH